MSATHLYVHLPFCAHRCGYCDFVTALGEDGHDDYVAALLGELRLEAEQLQRPLQTIFLGGGTPSYTAPDALARLLAALPQAAEVTVEANPETVTPALATLLRDGGVTRVSVGVQSFQPRLLEVLGRLAGPEQARRTVGVLRDAGFDNVSLDLIYGIPGQSSADLEADLAQALALEPDHLSAYELEAKPGTRFTHRHGAALEAQAEAMESYLELVVATLTAAGYRWYETSNFCRADPSRDLRSQHNLGVWLGHDYLGIGVGAVSTVGERRWRNAPSRPRYLAALRDGRRPPRELELLSPPLREHERVMLGLRLDEPLGLAGLQGALDERGLARVEQLGLAKRSEGELVLSERGRFLADAVAVELLR